jgi:hypothetical protein
MTQSLIDNNRKIKLEANRLLFDRGLLGLLNTYGKAHVTGSYSLDLMTWRDLDLYLEVESITNEWFFALGGKISQLLAPARMQFRNEHLVRTPGLPHGFYWGVHLTDQEVSWKVDIWAVNNDECDRLLKYCENIRAQLDDGTSSTILSIKSQCWQDPDYRRVYTSADIYDAVLSDGIKDIDGFWK